MTNILIIGSGVVGQATGKGFASKGHEVWFYDINKEVLKQLEHEGFRITYSVDKIMESISIVFICIPNSYIFLKDEFVFPELEKEVKNIAQYLNKQLIVIRSTVLPGTTRRLSLLIPPEQLAYNPEFLREKTALEDFLNPDRIVIGVESPTAGLLLRSLYQEFHKPIIEVSWEVAEMAKLVSNAMLATKISFFNEVWMICQKMGIDADMVAEIVSLDKRIGPYGIKGGRPFGGKCLPKDLQGLIQFCERILKFKPEVLNAVQLVNNRLDSILEEAKKLAKSHVERK
jgi:UDPglucose 6-dehydrogenase